MKNVLIDWGPRISILILRFLNFCPQLFSLHIRSMWETICDAPASYASRKFWPNFTRKPCSGIWTEQTPLPWKWNFLLSSDWASRTPPPKMKLSFLNSDLSLHRTPPPLQKWNTLTFFPEFRSDYTETPPPVAVEVCGDCSRIPSRFYPQWQTKVFSWLRWFHISPGCFQIVRVFETAWSHLHYVLKKSQIVWTPKHISEEAIGLYWYSSKWPTADIGLRCMLNLKWIATVHLKCLAKFAFESGSQPFLRSEEKLISDLSWLSTLFVPWMLLFHFALILTKG